MIWLGYALAVVGGGLLGFGCALVAKGVIERRIKEKEEPREVARP